MSEPENELLEALSEMQESGEVSMAESDDEEIPAGPPAEEDAGEEEVEEEDEEEETEEEEEEEDQGEAEEVEARSFSTDDPTVLAYLARYDNDPSKALKAAVDLQRVLNRQGQEKNQALQRVAELEAALAEQQAFDTGPGFLTEEQQEYVENAIGSGQPQQWVQAAVREGEFGLARAITEEWANESPVQAIRASQMIDHIEAQVYAQPAEPERYDQNELLTILTNHFPDMPNYEAQMVMALANLGEYHPLVLGAKSADPEEAARSIVGLYEIAKASRATVSSTRAKVKKASNDAALAARDAAMVTSGSASPNHSQTPRPQMIVPGLSVDDLSAAMAEHQ